MSSHEWIKLNTIALSDFIPVVKWCPGSEMSVFLTAPMNWSTRLVCVAQGSQPLQKGQTSEFSEFLFPLAQPEDLKRRWGEASRNAQVGSGREPLSTPQSHTRSAILPHIPDRSPHCCRFVAPSHQLINFRTRLCASPSLVSHPRTHLPIVLSDVVHICSRYVCK